MCVLPVGEVIVVGCCCRATMTRGRVIVANIDFERLSRALLDPQSAPIVDDDVIIYVYCRVAHVHTCIVSPLYVNGR